MILSEKNSASRGLAEALRGLYANFLVQEFISEADSADLRCFVVGNQVVATMRRQAADGDFRSNLHLGGVQLPPPQARKNKRWQYVQHTHSD